MITELAIASSGLATGLVVGCLGTRHRLQQADPSRQVLRRANHPSMLDIDELASDIASRGGRPEVGPMIARRLRLLGATDNRYSAPRRRRFFR